jgi:hypothetical protein
MLSRKTKIKMGNEKERCHREGNRGGRGALGRETDARARLLEDLHEVETS